MASDSKKQARTPVKMVTLFDDVVAPSTFLKRGLPSKKERGGIPFDGRHCDMRLIEPASEISEFIQTGAWDRGRS